MKKLIVLITLVFAISLHAASPNAETSLRGIVTLLGVDPTGLNATDFLALCAAQTSIPPAKLGSGSRNGTKFLRDDGTWQTVSAGIAAGTGAIVNADVNASAAIAGTKISPAFGAQNITNTGNITATGGTVTASVVSAPTAGFSTFLGGGTATASSDPLSLGLTQLWAVQSGSNICGYGTAANILAITDGTIRGFVGHINASDGVVIGSYSPDRVTIRIGNIPKFYIGADGGMVLVGITTTARLALTPVEGETVYDSTLHKMYTYDGTTWQAHW